MKKAKVTLIGENGEVYDCMIVDFFERADIVPISYVCYEFFKNLTDRDVVLITDKPVKFTIEIEPIK